MANDVGQSSRTRPTPQRITIISTLLLILGPTASGKTARAIELAQHLDTEIISCDSRQFYSEMEIGVARPSPNELASVPHHFIACRSVQDPYNVYTYQQDALKLLDNLFQQHDTVVAVGGSSLYIEALCHGIALLPDPTPELRAMLQHKLHTEGVESLRSMLRVLDPDYYNQVDLANGVRIQRAVEVCITAGKPYSQLIQQPRRPRPFSIKTLVIERPREELRNRINQRVEQMIAIGLESEARKLYPLRHLTPLNTVGYKEFFALWEQQNNYSSSPSPSEAIKLNTWHYAKKQLTGLKKNAPLLST